MKSLETYESFKYKLLKNKYAYGTIKAECDKTGKSPEEIAKMEKIRTMMKLLK